MGGTQRLSNDEGRKLLQELAQKGRKGASFPAPKVSGHQSQESPPDGGKQAKYGNVKVPDPESTKPFDSKLEAKHGREYRLLAKIGEIISVTRQPKFHLQGGVIYIADFMILHNDYSVEIVDSKGVITPDFRNKEKLFRAMYPNLKFTVRMK